VKKTTSEDREPQAAKATALLSPPATVAVVFTSGVSAHLEHINVGADSNVQIPRAVLHGACSTTKQVERMTRMLTQVHTEIRDVRSSHLKRGHASCCKLVVPVCMPRPCLLVTLLGTHAVLQVVKHSQGLILWVGEQQQCSRRYTVPSCS
jgi:hypothetical protein